MSLEVRLLKRNETHIFVFCSTYLLYTLILVHPVTIMDTFEVCGSSLQYLYTSLKFICIQTNIRTYTVLFVTIAFKQCGMHSTG